MTPHIVNLLFLLLVAAPQESPEIAEVRHFMEVRSDAWEKWDFDALGAQFAEDAERWDARGHVFEGRADIDKHCREAFKTEESRQIRFQHKIDKIRIVTPGVAMVDASWKTELPSSKEKAVETPATQHAPGNRQGKSFLILRKNAHSDWEIVSLRASFTESNKEDEDAD